MTRLVKIGLFVLITGSGSIFYIMQTAETINAPDTYKVKAYIEDASGLMKGTRVWVSGVTVGRIRKVSLERGKALLIMEISSEVPVYRNAVLKKRSQSMLGNAVVALDPGTPQAVPIKEGEEIPQVISSTEMDRAFSAAEKVATEIDKFMQDLNAFMSEGGGYNSVESILSSAQDTVDTTNRMVEENLKLLSESLKNISEITARLNTSSKQDVRELSAILSSTARITERIDRILEEQDDDIAASADALKESIDRLNNSLASIEEITGKIEKGEGNIGRLIQDEEIFNRVDRVTKNVDEFIDTATGMEVQLGFKSEYLALQGATKNHAEVRLVPDSKPKYYSLGVTGAPEGLEKKTKTKTKVDTGSDGSIDSRETTYEKERSGGLKLNAQIARTYGPITIRGGIIESSAGVGFGYKPARQLQLSTELFEFNQADAPYLRGYGTLYPVYDPESNNPLNWLYLTGGVDNALKGDERDYFFGLGLRLTDNDLRAIMPFVPTP